MQVTIVGMPGAGKTTVFNALTGAHAETGTYSGGRAVPNVASVKVPDARLDALSALYRPRRTTPADVTYADVALAEGATREGSVPPEVLAQIRSADALLHVARAFPDPATGAEPDPWRDVAELDTEFAIADLLVIEKRLERLTTAGRHGPAAEREQAAREEVLLRRLEPELSAGRALRSVPLEPDEERLLRGFRFLSQKPALVVLNIDDRRLPEAAALEADGAARYEAPLTDVAALAGKIEAELMDLAADDARAFMDELGITEPSRGRVVRLTYRLLGLISFFTVGEDECRAWTLRAGSTAVDAAGVIHSDLARGFIRAEVIGVDELLELGSFAEARKRGRLRSEGKGYPVRDGDVVQVLFNVGR